MTTQVRLKGLTWDHRRAIEPMIETSAAFHRKRSDIAIDWDVQPLSGFEFRPLEEIVETYDLVVFDHPHIGHAAETGLLRPLDHLVPDDVFIGPTLATYRWLDRLWAIPVDAACQTACYRPDFLPDGPPRTWDDVMALGRERQLGASLNGVHAFMTFLTLAANFDAPCTTDPGQPLVSRDTALAVLSTMRNLTALCPPDTLDWNSIGLQDAMCARDDVVYCPFVYGFATYAEADRAPRLAFADIPDLGGRGPVGSTIGGAGLGLSAATAHPDAAEAFAAFVARSDTQCAIISRHHGQPAHRDAWHDVNIDARFGSFFSATRATIENSHIRPRYPGYMAVQTMAGPLIERHLRGEHDEAAVLNGLGII